LAEKFHFSQLSCLVQYRVILQSLPEAQASPTTIAHAGETPRAGDATGHTGSCRCWWRTKGQGTGLEMLRWLVQ